MFRAAHTVKGDARLYDLDELCAAAEALEQLFSDARDRLVGQEQVRFDALPRALELVEEARMAIAKARAKLVEASPIGAAILDQVTVRESHLHSLRQQVMRMHMHL